MRSVNLTIRHTIIILLIISAFCLAGCGDKEKETHTGTDTGSSSAQETIVSFRDSAPVVHAPAADGTYVHERNNVSLDCSNLSDGYVVLTYLGENEKVKFQITTPDKTKYTYLVTKYGQAVTFPLTGGNGDYTFVVLESVDLSQDLYAIAFSQNETVSITDEFMPFLVPNVYADFAIDSACVAQGQVLATECTSDLEVIENIYNYVTQNIAYDNEKALAVSYGYTPVPDETLTSGSGICFDYASLMTSMLRSQQIPTRLEVGYAGEIYHAWISCYVYEIGWVDNIIQFDGEHWSLMDPTLAASNSNYAVQEYIGDGSNYVVKYTY